MALKMVHLIIHRLEDGVQAGIHEIHNARDAEYQRACDYWRELGNDDEPPSWRFDLLVPAQATDDQIAAKVQRSLEQAMMLHDLRSIMLALMPR